MREGAADERDREVVERDSGEFGGGGRGRETGEGVRGRLMRDVMLHIGSSIKKKEEWKEEGKRRRAKESFRTSVNREGDINSIEEHKKVTQWHRKNHIFSVAQRK